MRTLLAVLLSAAVVSPATAAEPHDYRRQAAAAIKAGFRDPSSIRDAMITPPAPRMMGAATRNASCVRLNAKNGFGGYTGAVDYVAVFDPGGRLISFHEDVSAACWRVTGYQPFLEVGRASANR